MIFIFCKLKNLTKHVDDGVWKDGHFQRPGFQVKDKAFDDRVEKREHHR